MPRLPTGILRLAVPFLLCACRSSSVPAEHRPASVACALGTPVASISTGGACQSLADCAPGPNVACVHYADAGASFCNYDACHLDGDCADGGVCACASASAGSTRVNGSNTCLTGGNCRIDSDCNPVHFCSRSSTGCGATFAWYCHGANDDCMTDTDCRGIQICQYEPSAGRWTCVNASACGG